MGYFPPSPPPPPKKNTTRTVLIIVGAVLALCCCGAVVGGFALFKTAKNAVGPVQDSADAFVSDLESGNTAAAYASLCPQARSAFTAAQFDQIVGTRPKITSHDIVSAFVRNINGKTTASADAQLRYADGSSETHTLVMVKDSGTWRVCGNPY
ncbi:Rv0361 family membrane protein [Paractinoplanes globisporus]|uniref:DUF4878 domain-containing protein n=1 Tax=Paractinoplanes globisporus TaxID=113565 RepID=A0ABW6WF77_9ACTN|nr:DUF4878 domain-containing protein [Actinoplanes globisporus]